MIKRMKKKSSSKRMKMKRRRKKKRFWKRSQGLIQMFIKMLETRLSQRIT